MPTQSKIFSFSYDKKFLTWWCFFFFFFEIWKNLNIISSSRSITMIKYMYTKTDANFFSYKFSVLKFEFTAQKCTRMHYFEAIFQKFPRGDSGTPPAWPPPPAFFALQWSLRFWTSIGASAVFHRAPEEKKNWTPLHSPSFMDILIIFPRDEF